MGMDKSLISLTGDISQLNPVELYPHEVCVTERSTVPIFLVPGSPGPLYHRSCTSRITRQLAILNFHFSFASENMFGHLDLLVLQRR